jgi:hypothetical protein
MSDNKPKTIKEAFERIERMKALVEQAQTALDTEIYNLKAVAGSTFEHEGKRYQVRTPNTNKKDRKHTVVQHPFIVELKTTPKEAKAAARIRKSGLSDDEVKANLETLVALEGGDPTPIVVLTTAEVVHHDTFAEAALVRDDTDETTPSVDYEDDTSSYPEDVVAAGASDDDGDDIVIE